MNFHFSPECKISARSDHFLVGQKWPFLLYKQTLLMRKVLDEIFRNRKIFNKYIKNFDLDAVELVGTGMTSVEALKAVVTGIG